MKTYLLRGVPHSLQSDGWWLSGAPLKPPSPPNSDAETSCWWQRAAGLLVLVVLADLLIWQVVPGQSLAVFGLAVLAMGWALAGCRGTAGLGLAGVLFLPVVERVQTLSLAFWLAGMLLGAGWIALARFPGLAGALRLVWHGPEQVFLDARHLHIPARSDLRSLTVGWGLPLGLGFVFLSLFTGANPLLESWLSTLLSLEGPAMASVERAFFWLGTSFLLWPFLSLARLRHRLALGVAAPRPRHLPAVFNEASVRRSLLLFNAVFALQTLSDLAILWGGATLPDGMSHAEYAHRGAYPLLVAALLAGVFALAARPFTTGSAALRIALLGWLLQTLFLVVSSLTRLESYILTYGLTHLRLAALIWMGLVAAGILLVLWQVHRGHSAAWMLKRCAALGAGTLYACAFLPFAAVIADFNLGHDVAPDRAYICALDRAALPAIVAHERFTRRGYCPVSHRPRLTAPSDWREWGFRDWRTARSLAELSPAQEMPAWPTY